MLSGKIDINRAWVIVTLESVEGYFQACVFTLQTFNVLIEYIIACELWSDEELRPVPQEHAFCFRHRVRHMEFLTNRHIVSSHTLTKLLSARLAGEENKHPPFDKQLGAVNFLFHRVFFLPKNTPFPCGNKCSSVGLVTESFLQRCQFCQSSH